MMLVEKQKQRNEETIDKFLGDLQMLRGCNSRDDISNWMKLAVASVV